MNIKRAITKTTIFITILVSIFLYISYKLLYTGLPVNILSYYLKQYHDIEIRYSNTNGYLLSNNGLSINNLEYNHKSPKLNINFDRVNLKLSSFYFNKADNKDNSKLLKPSPTDQDPNILSAKILNYNFKINVNNIKIKYNNEINKIADIKLDINNCYREIFYEIYYGNTLVLWKNYKSIKNFLELDLKLDKSKAIEILDIMPKVNNFNIKADINSDKIKWNIRALQQNSNHAFVIKGHTNLLHYIPNDSKFNISSNNILLVNTGEAKIYGTPDISLNIISNKNNIDITGNIHIDNGLIIPPVYKKILPSEDIVFIDEEPKGTANKDKILDTKNTKTKSDLIINTNIKIQASKNLFFKSPDLNTGLIGEVNIVYNNDHSSTLYTPNAPLAQGEIKLENCEYILFGNKLKIKQGILLFNNGYIDNPNIKITIEKQVNIYNYNNSKLNKSISNNNPTQKGVDNEEFLSTNTPTSEGKQTATVGANIYNTLNNPRINLYSSKSMNEMDKISYLLFGVPGNKIDEAQGQILLQAAKSLFTNDSLDNKEYLNITKHIKKLFDFDEINIENKYVYNQNTGTSNKLPTVVVGKKFFNRLLIKYSHSFSNTEPNYNIISEYKINHYLSLIARYNSSGSSSTDIVFSKETDKIL